jgi:hypothetical protein
VFLDNRNKVRRSREKGLKVNALVPTSEEGRNKLRKASGSRIWRRSGDVRMGKPGQSNVWSPVARQGQTQGIETSQYLEEEKSKEIPSVAASESGRA